MRKLGSQIIKSNKGRYHEKIVKYFENPPNVGSMDKNKKNVGTGTVGSLACGDLLKF